MYPRSQILILSQDSATCSKLTNWLQGIYITHIFQSVDELAESFLEINFDLCIVDSDLIENYEQYLHQLLKQQIGLIPPILLIATDKTIIKSLQHYSSKIAYDFIVAPIDQAELYVRVNILLRTSLLEQEKQRNEETISFINKAFEDASDAILLLDAHYNVVYQNVAFTELYEYTADDINETNITELLFEDIEICNDMIAKLLSDCHWEAECNIISKSGEIIPNFGKADCIYDQDGNLIGQAIFFTNVTALKKAQHDLEESEQQLRQLVENLDKVLWLRDIESEQILFLSHACERVWGRTVEEIYENPDEIVSIVHPDDRASFFKKWHHEYDRKMDTEYRIILDDEIRWMRIRHFPIQDTEGNIYRVAGSAEDITINKAIKSAEQQQRILTEALRDTATAITSTLDLSEVLDRILINVGNVVAHDLANIMLMDGQDVAYIARGSNYKKYGMKPKEIYTYRYPVNETPYLSDIMRTQQSVIIPDLERHDTGQLVGGLIDRWAKSYIGTPIFRKKKIIGFLNLTSKEADFFNPVHADRLMAFAEQVTIAIQNAQSYENAMALATLRERQRLARDLHDAVSQTLFSANIIAESIPTLWKQNQKRGAEKLNQLRQLTKGAQAEMRTLLLELRPDALLEATISELIYQLADALKGKSNVAIIFDIAECTLPENVHVAFYYIAQEALNNIAKHAEATKITIRLQRSQIKIILEVEDNGKGIDHHNTNSTSMGLKIMRERAESIDAELTIESQLEKGTKICLIWNS